MKIRLLFLFVFVMAFAVAGFAQSVVITGKKVTYNRPQPMGDHKKSFTINYPKVKAARPALSRRIESVINYETILGVNVKEEQTEIQWLEAADYEVGYNKNGILSIKLFMEGSGAYPSGSAKNVVVDLKTGMRVKPAAIFINLVGLRALVNKAKEKEIEESIIEMQKDPENAELEHQRLFDSAKEYNKLILDEFSVNDDGITFYYDYGFPHVIKALEPNGVFSYTWADLKPYIKRNGLLTRIAR